MVSMPRNYTKLNLEKHPEGSSEKFNLLNVNLRDNACIFQKYFLFIRQAVKSANAYDNFT